MSRILVVEDENWQAMELAWLVQDAGHAVVGPERSVADACRALAGASVDLALLDITLRDESVFPLSHILDARDVPFIFVTGDPGLLPAEYDRRPMMTKPWQPGALLSLIDQVLARRPAAASGNARAAAKVTRMPPLGPAFSDNASPDRGGAHADRVGSESRRSTRFRKSHG